MKTMLRSAIKRACKTHLQRLVHLPFDLVVDSARCFVQEGHEWAVQEQPEHGDALLLA